jgi:hypothetical protein
LAVVLVLAITFTTGASASPVVNDPGFSKQWVCR